MALSVGVFLHDLGIHHKFDKSIDWKPKFVDVSAQIDFVYIIFSWDQDL